MNDAEVLIKFKADDSEVDKASKNVSSKIGNIAKGVAKGIGVATTAAATAIAGLTKSAVSEFAEYEQLVGGVETLFGTGGMNVEEYAKKVGKAVDDVIVEWTNLDTTQEDVLYNAEQAYKTAGISANEYMSTISSFAASLKQSMIGYDPQDIANAADQAVIDMADNANKMGTEMGLIQSAYQGFAKQNYTMLDNLKLGYGGTKTEMERLLADATALSGVEYSIDSLNDVYSAIHVIQTELGITGTTAKEASTTISGSLNSTKSAFKNFLTSLGSGKGIDEAFSNLLESAMTFGENLMPVIETIVTSLANVIPTIIENLITILPGLIEQLLPPLITGAVALVNGLIQALPMLIQTLLPSLLQGMVSITEQIILLLPDLVLMIADMLPTLIPMVIDAIISIIPMLLEHLPEFIEAGFKLLGGLIAGIINAVPTLFFRIGEIGWKVIETIKNILSPSNLWNIGKAFLEGLWNGIKSAKDWVLDKIKGIGKGILGAVKGIFGIHSPSKEFAIIGEYNMLGLEKGMEDMQPEIQRDIDGMFDLSPSMTGSMNNVLSPVVNVFSNVTVEQDPLGQMVNNIKTFSGGTKNDYNYGAGV